MLMKKIKRQNIAQRKHHLIELGDMIMINGWGIRYDCMDCQDGWYDDSTPCPNCHAQEVQPNG